MLKRLNNYIKNWSFDLYTFRIAASTFAAVIFIGSLVLFFSYKTSVKKIEEVSFQLNRVKLTDIKSIVESNIRQADDIAISLSMDMDIPSLNQIQEMSYIEKYKKMQLLSNRLANFRNTNSKINSIYVYYKNLNTVLYDYLYADKDIIDLQSIPQDRIHIQGTNMFITSGTKIHAFTDTFNAIKLVRSFAVGTENGYVVVNMDANAISHLIDDMKVIKDEKIVILDSDNTPILFPDQKIIDMNFDWSVFQEGQDIFKSINNKMHIAVVTKSQYTGWTFISFVPLESVYASYKAVKTFRTVLLFIMLVLGAILSVIITITISKPLNRLYNMVNKKAAKAKGKDKIKYLSNVYNDMFSDNENLKQTIEKNMPLLRENFLMNILLNKVTSTDELDTRMDYVKLHFDFMTFCVVVLELEMRNHEWAESDYITIEICKEYIKSRLMDFCHYYIIQFEPNRVAIVLNYENTKIEFKTIYQLFTELIKELRLKVDSDLNIGISRQNCNSLSLNQSFWEALVCLDQKHMFGSNEVIFFDNIDYVSDTNCIYPFDLEQKLIGSIKSCNTEDMKSVLGKISDFISSVPGKNVFVQRQVFLQMISNVKQIIFEISQDEGIQSFEEFQRKLMISKMKTVDEFTTYIDNIAIYIIEYISKRRENKKQEIVNFVLKYIDANYSKNITIDDIASEVYISVPYLYRILKEEKGISPISYLTDVRVNKAAYELIHTQKPINDISDECGFENVQSFYRHFKKAMNCSPSNYRERFV